MRRDGKRIKTNPLHTANQMRRRDWDTKPFTPMMRVHVQTGRVEDLRREREGRRGA